MSINGKAYIAGIYEHPTRLAKDISLAQIHAQVAKGALEDAGLSKDDPRVQSAVRWIRAHYTLEENPGMGQAGLYYYYHTFAKAMTALGEDQFEDARKVKHDWRKELLEALKKRQRADGSFVNKGDRAFGEGDPNLATAFALLTLSYLKTPAK